MERYIQNATGQLYASLKIKMEQDVKFHELANKIADNEECLYYKEIPRRDRRVGLHPSLSSNKLLSCE